MIAPNASISSLWTVNCTRTVLKSTSRKVQEEKALHDLTMYTFLVDYKNIPESVHQKMNSLQQSIGLRLAAREMERRKKDPNFVNSTFLLLL